MPSTTIKKRSGLIRIIAFWLIFAMLFSGMAITFSHLPEHETFYRLDGFYKEPEGSLQGVCIGSSNCYAYWNSLVAWENYGLAFYPYATSSQPFYAVEYVMREVRKTQPDAMMIVHINAVADVDMIATDFHSTLRYMPNSQIKRDLMDRLSALIGYSKLDQWEFYQPWIRSREYWPQILAQGFFPEPDGMKGASHYDKFLKDITDLSDAYLISDAKSAISDELTACVESLLDYCDAENLQVLFINSPRAEDSLEHLGRINTVTEMIRARGYEVLYLTDQLETLDLDVEQDFYNDKHTNIHGSIKYTNYICEYLMENYDLRPLGDNFDSESWNEAARAYMQGISPAILDIEMDTSKRSMDIEKPQNLRIEKDDQNQVLLDWNEVEGADAYLVYRKDGYTASWNQIDQVEENRFVDADCASGIQYHYTVVPVCIENDEPIYGNFSYTGVNIKL